MCLVEKQCRAAQKDLSVACRVLLAFQRIECNRPGHGQLVVPTCMPAVPSSSAGGELPVPAAFQASHVRFTLLQHMFSCATPQHCMLEISQRLDLQ